MPLPKIANKFNGAIQKSDQERKIAELQAEVEKLRSERSPELEQELQLLREQIQHQSGEIQVQLDLIDPNLNQPRQTITPESVQAKARLMKKYGQNTPVILIPQDNGRHLILDGHLRTEAAKSLGWDSIKALVVPQPEDLEQSALLTFLGSEDLNPLDKAEAIFREVTKVTELGLDDVVTRLNTILKRIERDKKTKELSNLVTLDTQNQREGLERIGLTGVDLTLFLTLLEYGLNPGSVKANLLPMLFLPIELKEAIRQGLKGAHALALATLSAKQLKVSETKAARERKMAVKKVMEYDLTVAETRELVKEIKRKYEKSVEKSPSTESKEVKTAIARISNINKESLITATPHQLEQLRMILREKLAEVEALS